jgi:hypothetical protein
MGPFIPFGEHWEFSGNTLPLPHTHTHTHTHIHTHYPQISLADDSLPEQPRLPHTHTLPLSPLALSSLLNRVTCDEFDRIRLSWNAHEEEKEFVILFIDKKKTHTNTHAEIVVVVVVA